MSKPKKSMKMKKEDKDTLIRKKTDDLVSKDVSKKTKPASPKPRAMSVLRPKKKVEEIKINDSKRKDLSDDTSSDHVTKSKSPDSTKIPSKIDHKTKSPKKNKPKIKLNSISEDEDETTSIESKAVNKHHNTKEVRNKKKKTKTPPKKSSILDSDDDSESISTNAVKDVPMNKPKFNLENKKHNKDDDAKLKKNEHKPVKKVKNEVKQMDVTQKYGAKRINEIPIHFNFCPQNKNAFNSFNMDIDLNKTIEEISLMINLKFNIEDKIEIQYKDIKSNIYITIDRKMQVNDIIEEMTQIGKHGSTNELYIKISRKNNYIDIKKYKVIRCIGSGANGNVYEVEDKKSMRYAAKVIYNNGEFKREVYIMGLINNHPRIIKSYGASPIDFDNNENTTIIMDLAPKGSLGDYFKKIHDINCHKYKMTNTQHQIILVGIAIAMSYLHSNNIMHRDLKPDNILLDKDNYPYITDFGLSKLYQMGEENTVGRGTPLYQAPETFDNDNYGMDIDVYSFSLILYEIVTGKQPFSKKFRQQNCYTFAIGVINGQRPIIDDSVNSQLKELMQLCWDSNPEIRPTFEKIAQLLAFDERYYLDDVDKEAVISFARKNGLRLKK